MSRLDRSELLDALRRSNGDWLLRYWGDQVDRFLEETSEKIKGFITLYQEKYHDLPDPLRLLSENVTKGTAFFHIDTIQLSSKMKCAVWRVLLGSEVEQIELSLDSGKRTALTIRLRSPDGALEVFESTDPADYRMLRHFGTVLVNGALALQGYYAPKPH